MQKRIATSVDGPMDMLGIIQSQKTAELLLDLNVSSVICSAQTASIETAMTISKVQEAADCLGAKSVLRTVGIERLQDLEVESILNLTTGLYTQKPDEPLNKPEHGWYLDNGRYVGTIKGPQLTPGWLDSLDDGVITEVWYRSEKVWKTLLDKLCNESGAEENMVVVGHPAVHIALIGHCLNLTKEWMGSFHLDAGSISVIDFPDGPAGRGEIRCINYTAHLGRWSIPVMRSMVDKEEM
ncbi:hypothetical protein IFM89_002098 [Coptis chinensis]|uniref:Histidine phosphatase family protein n=1 Tax=Coptis chinensis TaxID=261450 RepID=A0A835LD60_9MAGN|nr:hypothetical protein IFM89_002098 [Coptis chinensis]